MKSTFFITLLVITTTFSNSLLSQEITVEKIWKEYEFFGKSVSGFRSMNDGNFFSKISKTSEGVSVTKHSFSDYEGKGEVLIDPNSIKEIEMQGYSFNSDETKALIETEKKQYL